MSHGDCVATDDLWKWKAHLVSSLFVISTLQPICFDTFFVLLHSSFLNMHTGKHKYSGLFQFSRKRDYRVGMRFLSSNYRLDNVSLEFLIFNGILGSSLDLKYFVRILSYTLCWSDSLIFHYLIHWYIQPSIFWYWVPEFLCIYALRSQSLQNVIARKSRWTTLYNIDSRKDLWLWLQRFYHRS